MSISAIKQALEALEEIHRTGDTQAFDLCYAPNVIPALRQAIAEAEKQEPVAIGGEWKPCVKLPIVVHVREQRKGETHVSTREGITPVKEDDLIMRGVAGEEYPIGRELFNRTYTFDTAPVHASDISQERVDETAKHGHEPVPNDYDRSIHSNPDAQAWAKFFMATVNEQEWCIDDIDESLMTGWFANAMMAMHDHVKREWVGLTDKEVTSIIREWHWMPYELCKVIEAKLKEKNT
jgi:hypothetical protein